MGGLPKQPHEFYGWTPLKMGGLPKQPHEFYGWTPLKMGGLPNILMVSPQAS